MVGKVKVHRRKHTVNFKSSNVVIAIAQIDSPLPDAIGNGVVDGRETLVWKSLAQMELRVDKVCGIIDALNKLTPKADIIVFPEYSFPANHAIDKLQEKADKYSQIIIGGSDLIKEDNKIYNEVPIVFPNKKTSWIKKRELSKWETGLIDQPKEIDLPILTWKVDNTSYWLKIYICLDFSLAPQEIRSGGGIFIVPMCSPKVEDFRGWANSLLRLENGTATILCNCVGEGARGQSSVISIKPDKDHSKMALELSNTEEVVSVFEIECKYLQQPQVTVPKIKPPLGNRYFYIPQVTPRGVELVPKSVEPKSKERGVINPFVFNWLGKRMRLAFLEVSDYASVAEKVRNKDFEVLAVLGQHDLIITDLNAYRYDMIYDINQIVNWKSSSGVLIKSDNNQKGSLEEEFPFFRVDRFFKVLGVPVKEEDKKAFNAANSFISLEELVQLMKLGEDWDDKNVEPHVKKEFLDKRWILETTDKNPGDISAVMAIHLEHTGKNIKRQQDEFEESIIPKLNEEKSITSIYRGVGNALKMHYILRMSATIQELYPLIEMVHQLTYKAKLLISTTTYVSVKTLSNLSLEKAVLLPNLPRPETQYRDEFIYPLLPQEERMRLIYLPEQVQRELIKNFHHIQESLSRLHKFDWFEKESEEINKKLALGLLNRDFTTLKMPHDFLQRNVEMRLEEYINKNVSESQLDNLRSSLNIQSNKKIGSLSYSERVELLRAVFDETNLDSEILIKLDELKKTKIVRNAFTHDPNWGKIKFEEYIPILPIYSTFLESWENFLFDNEGGV